jgi:hypothetical protein
MAYMKRMSEANIPTNLMQPQELLRALTTSVVEGIIYITLLHPHPTPVAAFPPTLHGHQTDMHLSTHHKAPHSEQWDPKLYTSAYVG